MEQETLVTQMKKDSWGSRVGFMLAAIGSAVGLGNIWRFNYIAYENGGGSFMLVYVIAMITCAIPFLLLEYVVGHKFRRTGPIAFKKIDNRLEFIGWIPAMQMLIVAGYYIVILGWCGVYLVNSFNLAWTSNIKYPKGAVDFFNSVLNINPSGNPAPLDFASMHINWPVFIAVLVIWVLTWLTCSTKIQKGIEAAAYVLMPLLAIISIVLIIRGVTLDGAMTGISAYLTPDWTKLGETKVWVAAYSQVFFSLSIGFGIMITFSSYLPEEHRASLPKSALTVALSNSGYEVIMGFATWGTLGHLAKVRGIEIAEVAKGGIGMAFVTFPEALAKIPVLPNIFAILFFLTLLVAGYTSSITLIEGAGAAFIDKFRSSRLEVMTWMCIIGLIMGFIYCTNEGLYWLDIVDHFVNQYVLLFMGVLTCFAVGWIYGIDRMVKYLQEVTQFKIGEYWKLCILYITPVLLTLIFVSAIRDDLKTLYSGYEVLELRVIGLGALLLIIVIAGIVTATKGHKDFEIDFKNDQLMLAEEMKNDEFIR